ncbi:MULTISPECIES: hypothetical protein [unclassified Halomonas]|uniref:hypothetical protein n=1 Tax=unclassified Halomonas TaxID=2609666 RepID=UPI0003B8A2F9|nr:MULTISPECIES: hypothetical protein [unclassified Halomonas]ERS89926.1 hypothetical protein Q671_05850 [Halomonas sp. PBN3]
MTSEPHRLQYLEAMGLTGWAARYVLPNARPTPACEWETPAAPAAAPPGERLHALLGEAREQEPASRKPAASPERAARPPRPGRARVALLGEAPVAEAPSEPETAEAAPEAPREALRFAFQVACLEGRWLLLLPGEAPPGRTRLRLLANLLRGAGIASPLPVFQPFHWPLQEGLPVQEPLAEAREGLRAFLNGASRRGWAPRRLLMFGDDEALARVLALEEGRSVTLDLPAWQAPALGALAAGAEAKRALLPRLLEMGKVWCAEADEAGERSAGAGDDGQDGDGH